MHKNSRKASVPESDKLSPNDLKGSSKEEIRQMSQYTNSKAAPLNDVFFEHKANPLSSKGN